MLSQKIKDDFSKYKLNFEDLTEDFFKKRFSPNPFLLELLENKSVSYVCPAPTKEENNAFEIDSRDIVCRVGISEHPSYLHNLYGKKTDIIVTGGSNYWIKDFEEKYELTSFPELKCFINPLTPTINLGISKKYPLCYDFNYSEFTLVTELFKMIPNTGIMGLFYIMNYPIKELFISGLNFYNFDNYNETPVYFENYCDPPMMPNGNKLSMGHSQYPQIVNFIKLLKLFPEKIKIDSYLRSGLLKYYSEEIEVLGVKNFFF